MRQEPAQRKETCALASRDRCKWTLIRSSSQNDEGRVQTGRTGKTLEFQKVKKSGLSCRLFLQEPHWVLAEKSERALSKCPCSAGPGKVASSHAGTGGGRWEVAGVGGRLGVKKLLPDIPLLSSPIE